MDAFYKYIFKAILKCFITTTVFLLPFLITMFPRRLNGTNQWLHTTSRRSNMVDNKYLQQYFYHIGPQKGCHRLSGRLCTTEPLFSIRKGAASRGLAHAALIPLPVFSSPISIRASPLISIMQCKRQSIFGSKG